MKRLIILFFLVAGLGVSAQSLTDIYKKGTVRLIPDETYGQGNDWNKLFDGYGVKYAGPYGSINYAGIGKSMVLAPDGSTLINHSGKDYYSLFDPNGKFVKNLEITDKAGKAMKRIPHVKGVINNNLFTVPDNLGKMLSFDSNGNYIKTLTLNYMVFDMAPMKDNKIAVVGWTQWKTKHRTFVAIVDYNTNEEKIIWDHFVEKNTDPPMVVNMAFFYEMSRMENVTRTIKTPIPSHSIIENPLIAYIADRLVVAIPSSGEILIYDTNGKQLAKEKVSWKTESISVEAQKHYKKMKIDKYREAELAVNERVTEAEAKEAKEKLIGLEEAKMNEITEPLKLPYISTIIKDSDGNLLFFEFPKEEGANKFNVWIYENGGKFVCRSSFVCDGYNLSINPQKMIFRNGYIYALLTQKNAQGIPLRLARFKLE